MKYVIWGMGQNGLELYSLMPENSICALVDKDKDSVYDRDDVKMPILSFDEYLEQRRELPEHIIVLSPFKYQGMERLLKENEIKNYSALKKSSVGMLAYASLFDKTYVKKLRLKNDEMYSLYQKGFYQRALYEQMLQDGFSVSLTERESEQAELLSEHSINDLYYNIYNQEIRSLKDSLKGEDVFVIGTGPSLTAEDLDALYDHGCISIGTNDIYHIFAQTKWRPDFYFASDRAQLLKYTYDREMNQAVKPMKKIFSDNLISLMRQSGHEENMFFFRQIQDYTDMRFSLDCSEGVYCSNTVIYGALQFAVYIGAKRIFLLGCDNGIAPGKKVYFYEDEMINSNYDSWERILTDAYADMEIGYRIARQETEKIGVAVFNATRGGFLEVFERVALSDLF